MIKNNLRDILGKGEKLLQSIYSMIALNWKIYNFLF